MSEEDAASQLSGAGVDLAYEQSRILKGAAQAAVPRRGLRMLWAAMDAPHWVEFECRRSCRGLRRRACACAAPT